MLEKRKETEREIQMDFKSGDGIRKFFEAAFSGIERDKDTFLREIINSTFRVMSKSGASINMHEIKEFASYINGQIMIFLTKLMGKKKACTTCQK